MGLLALLGYGLPVLNLLALALTFRKEKKKNDGMVQSDMLKGNAFQGSTTARNTYNSLLQQELRTIQRSAGFREVLPCFEPCQNDA